MKRLTLGALLLVGSSIANACLNNQKIYWVFPDGLDQWLVGFSFYVDGVQVGTMPITAREATCEEVGIVGTTKRITMRTYREDQESMDSNNLDLNLEAPGEFNLKINEGQ